MSIVYKNELNSANNSNALKTLESLNNISSNVYASLDTFQNESSTKLSGRVFTLTNAKLSVYKEQLQKINNIYNDLIVNIRLSNNEMLAYMEGYDVLDTQSINELEAIFRNAKSDMYDTEGETSTNTDEDILFLNHHLELLRNLDSKDKSLFSRLSSSFGQLNQLNNSLAMTPVGWTKNQYMEHVINMYRDLESGNRNVVYFNQRGWINGNGELIPWIGNEYINNAYNVAEDGCSFTCCAIIAATMLNDPTITPEAFIAKISEMSKNGSSGGVLDILSQGYGLNCTVGAWSPNVMELLLKSGGAVLMSVDGPDGSPAGHYITLMDVRYNEKTGQREFLYCDPYAVNIDGKNTYRAKKGEMIADGGIWLTEDEMWNVSTNTQGYIGYSQYFITNNNVDLTYDESYRQTFLNGINIHDMEVYLRNH